METKKFTEIIKKTELPFVYSGSKLNDEKCQGVIKKLNAEGTVLGVITGNSLTNIIGLVITEKGIWFDLPSGTIAENDKSKSKGAFLFDSFILNNVTLKRSDLQKFNVSFLLFDLEKAKSFTFQFDLIEDNLEIHESMINELEEIFKTLISKTGTEYVPVENKDPSIFDFIWESIHTNIVLNNDNVTVSKLKIDEKTTIQTPAGAPETISRSIIASVTKGRNFSPSTLFKSIITGVGFFISVIVFSVAIRKILSFIFEVGDTIIIIGFWIGLIGFILLALIGIFSSFPKTLVIKRKDGKKIISRLASDEENTIEYERLINAIFK